MPSERRSERAALIDMKPNTSYCERQQQPQKASRSHRRKVKARAQGRATAGCRAGKKAAQKSKVAAMVAGRGQGAGSRTVKVQTPAGYSVQKRQYTAADGVVHTRSFTMFPGGRKVQSPVAAMLLIKEAEIAFGPNRLDDGDLEARLVLLRAELRDARACMVMPEGYAPTPDKIFTRAANRTPPVAPLQPATPRPSRTLALPKVYTGEEQRSAPGMALVDPSRTAELVAAVADQQRRCTEAGCEGEWKQVATRCEENGGALEQWFEPVGCSCDSTPVRFDGANRNLYDSYRSQIGVSFAVGFLFSGIDHGKYERFFAASGMTAGYDAKTFHQVIAPFWLSHSCISLDQFPS